MQAGGTWFRCRSCPRRRFHCTPAQPCTTANPSCNAEGPCPVSARVPRASEESGAVTAPEAHARCCVPRAAATPAELAISLRSRDVLSRRPPSATRAPVRNVLRPPVTGDRLAVAAGGRVVLGLRHPWADGTTHVAFEPTAFLERLAVLVPRPRINPPLYHGVLAAHAAWRSDVVPRAPAGEAAPVRNRTMPPQRRPVRPDDFGRT